MNKWSLSYKGLFLSSVPRTMYFLLMKMHVNQCMITKVSYNNLMQDFMILCYISEMIKTGKKINMFIQCTGNSKKSPQFFFIMKTKIYKWNKQNSITLNMPRLWYNGGLKRCHSDALIIPLGDFRFHVQICRSIPIHFSICRVCPSVDTVIHLCVFVCTIVLSCK